MDCPSIPDHRRVEVGTGDLRAAHHYAPDVNAKGVGIGVGLERSEISRLAMVPHNSGLDDISASVDVIGSACHLVAVIHGKAEGARPPVEQGQRVKLSVAPDESLTGQKYAVEVAG